MKQIIECVPNISEGRDMNIINQVTAEIEKVEGVKLLDVDPGATTNRTVITFVGEPKNVCEAAFRVVKKAAELIDMRNHHGDHPRFGATDVCPLVPVACITMEELVEYSILISKSQNIWAEAKVNNDYSLFKSTLKEIIDFNKRYRLFIVGNLYGRAKFANKITFSRWQKEKYREFFTYQYYLSHYFSSGLFFTENSNPIYADVFYAFDGFDYENNDRIVLFTNNEYYTHEELVNYAFIANYRYIKQDMVNKLSARKNEKLILSDSDIVIYLSDDAFTEKIILYFFQKTHFNNEN